MIMKMMIIKMMMPILTLCTPAQAPAVLAPEPAAYEAPAPVSQGNLYYYYYPVQVSRTNLPTPALFRLSLSL